MNSGGVEEEELEAFCDIFAVGQEVCDQIAGMSVDHFEDVPAPLSRLGGSRSAYVSFHVFWCMIGDIGLRWPRRIILCMVWVLAWLSSRW